MPYSRRDFFASGLAGLAGLSMPNPGPSLMAQNYDRPDGDIRELQQVNETGADQSVDPIVDTHTHFYDPTRPQGIPWPSKDDALLYRPVLPKEFKALTKPFGVTGTVIVEASPWVEDNQWLLDQAAEDPFVLGIVGNLTPGTEQFATQMARFTKNPLFRGIRVNAEPVNRGLEKPEFVADLKRLIDADLELDINGGPEMLMIAHRLADRLPQLRVVINHLSNVKIDGKEPPAEWLEGLKVASKHERVFLKVSGYVDNARINGGKAPDDVSIYVPVLEAAWDSFGEDHLIYGSNWPVSDYAGPYSLIIQIATEFFRDKSLDAKRKFFAGNAEAAYRWRKRQ